MITQHNNKGDPMDKLVIGYSRVSTEEQAGEGQSLEIQDRKIRQYCEFTDLTLSEIITDAGISGKTIDKRPGVKKLMDLVRADRVSDVIILKIDRLGRNTIDLLTMAEEFQQHGVTFHSINERIDTNSPMGKFFLRLLAIFAEFERDMIVERTRAAMRNKKVNHEKVSRYAAPGFKVSEDGKTMIESEEEQKAIKLAAKIRAAHPDWGLRRISSSLLSRGFKNKAGRPFGPQSVKKLIALA